MGTTSPKNLRYPEPTTEARTLHTQVKNLADDANAALVYQDTRLNNLDSKTNTTNNDLNARGIPQWRYGNAAGVYTHSPNDGVNRTISQHTDQFYVHPSANYIQISMMQACYASTNAAGYWEPLVNFGGTGWQLVNGTNLRVHNQAQPVVDLGFHVVGMFNAQPYRNMAGSIATNFNNDPGSGSWVVHGHLFWSVVSLT